MLKITVPGKPIAKKRPRFARAGKFVRTYKDPKELTEEGRFLFYLQQQISGDVVYGPISVSMRFYMPIPKSASRKVREAISAGKYHHTKKPDLDNLEKFVLDCMNKEVFRDDAQVVVMSSSKEYSDDPRTVVEIERIG